MPVLAIHKRPAMNSQPHPMSDGFFLPPKPITKQKRLAMGSGLLKQWHGMLRLSQQSPPSWYRDRLQEELREQQTANTFWQKLSETSDVFFSIS